MKINCYLNKNADSNAADDGTDQLSSPTGINSTPAVMTAIASSLTTKADELSPNASIAPVLVNQEINPQEVKKDPATNAALPAMDLSLLKNHLLFDPNRLPTKSASPSPPAIVATDTTPMGESVQKISVLKSKIMT